MDSEKFRKLVFLNYDEILSNFEMLNKKTKSGNPITHKDLRTAILIMLEKHPHCRWRSERIKRRYFYIVYEGFIWLRDVYFDNYETKFIDKDVSWFEERIKWYQQQFEKNNIEYPKLNLDIYPMTKKELAENYNVSSSSVQRAFIDYEKSHTTEERYYLKGKQYFSVGEVEWMLKNKFKAIYLEKLEKYKMELTEIYKQNGGYYDDFFGRN